MNEECYRPLIATLHPDSAVPLSVEYVANTVVPLYAPGLDRYISIGPKGDATYPIDAIYTRTAADLLATSDIPPYVAQLVQEQPPGSSEMASYQLQLGATMRPDQVDMLDHGIVHARFDSRKTVRAARTAFQLHHTRGEEFLLGDLSHGGRQLLWELDATGPVVYIGLQKYRNTDGYPFWQGMGGKQWIECYTPDDGYSHEQVYSLLSEPAGQSSRPLSLIFGLRLATPQYQVLAVQMDKLFQSSPPDMASTQGLIHPYLYIAPLPQLGSQSLGFRETSQARASHRKTL